MQELVKQDLRGVGDDFKCAMEGTDNVIWYGGEGKGLNRNGIQLGRKRRSRMLVHRVDVAEGGPATLLRPCSAGLDLGSGQIRLDCAKCDKPDAVVTEGSGPELVLTRHRAVGNLHQ